MSFLAPLFLAGAAAAAVPIVLHLLKRVPEERVKFTAVKLLKQAPVEHSERHRLRELLLLALRVAALVLLAVAFARPFFTSGETFGRAGTVVVALDTSYSMSAPGRFERAREMAKDAIAHAAAGDLVGVVTFGESGRIAARPSVDRVLAVSAVDQAAAGFESTRYRSALSASMQALAGQKGTVVVVTDLQESGWDPADRVSLPSNVTLEIRDIGPLPPNLAVVGVRVLSDRVTAVVRNDSPSVRQVRAHLAVDGRASGEADVPVGPGQSEEVTFAGAPHGTGLSVTVEDPEGIQADNVRYAALTSSSQPAVLVVNGSGDFDHDAFYVNHALAAGGQGGSYRTEPSTGARLSTEFSAPGSMDSYAALMLLSTRGLERRGRELLAAYVRSGGGLFLAAGPEVDSSVVADVLGEDSPLQLGATPAASRAVTALAPVDARHPVFRPFTGSSATLGLVKFQRFVDIEGRGCQTLARFTSGGPALIECPAGEGRALVFASDLDNRWNDFPVHASFVPFIHESVRYLASARAHGSEYLVGSVPPAAPNTPGIHVVKEGGRAGGERRIAVNVDPRESDPTRISSDEFRAAVTRVTYAGTSIDLSGAHAPVALRQREDRQHVWQYVLALMILVLAGEGFLASRTV